MKILICVLMLLIACSVSASTVFLTDGQKRETGKCTITKHSEIIECLPKEVGGRTQSIPLKAIKQIIRDDGSVLTRADIEQFVENSEGQKSSAKSTNIGIAYKNAINALLTLKTDVDKKVILPTPEANTLTDRIALCNTLFSEQYAPPRLSDIEQKIYNNYVERSELSNNAINGFLKIIKELDAKTPEEKKLENEIYINCSRSRIMGTYYLGLALKIKWDSIIKQQKLDIPIEKIE